MIILMAYLNHIFQHVKLHFLFISRQVSGYTAKSDSLDDLANL